MFNGSRKIVKHFKPSWAATRGGSFYLLGSLTSEIQYGSISKKAIQFHPACAGRFFNGYIWSFVLTYFLCFTSIPYASSAVVYFLFIGFGFMLKIKTTSFLL